jgi:hypothetical protein
VAGKQHSFDGSLALGERALLEAPLSGKPRGFDTKPIALELRLRKRAVGL